MQNRIAKFNYYIVINYHNYFNYIFKNSISLFSVFMKVMDGIPFNNFPNKKENENKTTPQPSIKHKVINFRSRKGEFPEKS